MSVHPVSRLAPESTGHNTLNLRTIKLFFQKSPGKLRGDKRGIPGLEFRTVVDGVIIRTMTSDQTGMIEVPIQNGTVTLELLHQGTPVSVYEISVDDAPLAPVDTRLGQQQGLRHLGYQIAHDGPTGDGVRANGPPPDGTPPPAPAPNLEEDEDDREHRARVLKERQDNPLIAEKNFIDLNFFTERSILDFQADVEIFIDGLVGPIDGLVGPITKDKLMEAVGA